MPTSYESERGSPRVPTCGASPVSLTFNGSTLVLIGGSDGLKMYPAVSGKLGSHDPIPPGTYWIRPSEMWTRGLKTGVGLFVTDLFDGQPLGTLAEQHRAAWGNHRITIHPYPDTPVGDRGGFFIHGGTTPGSAGCIDLTIHMDTFVEDLLKALGDQRDCYIDLRITTLSP